MANDTILLQPAVAEDLDVGVGRAEVAAPSGGVVVGNKINIATFSIVTYFSWTPGTITAGSFTTTTITVPGAALGYIVAQPGFNEVLPIAADVDARIQTANTVRLSIFNRSLINPITLGALTGTVLVFFIPTEA